MTLKKYYGNTIEEARNKAKKQLGNKFIILETVPDDGNQFSYVTVMVDEDTALSVNQQKTELQTIHNASEDKNVSFVKSNSAIKKPLHYIQKVMNDPTFGFDLERKKSTSVTEQSQLRQNNKNGKAGLQQSDDISTDKQNLLVKRDHSLFHYETASEANERPHHLFKNGTSSDYHREIQSLRKQVKNLEAKFTESVILANIDYISHPAFQQLLSAGIPAITIATWFKNIMEKGINPDYDSQAFLMQLGKQLKNHLPKEAPDPPVQNIIFVGTSGSGKTSLIMGLLNDQNLFKKSKIAVVNINLPQNKKHYTILEPFCEDHKIPFYSVTSGTGLTKIHSHLKDFDHIFYDTASISLFNEGALQKYWQIRQLLASVTPLEIHMVVNANSQNILRKKTGNNPIQPDFIDITHLDENHKWGQLIPFIHPYQCNVRYISHGPGEIEKFEPEPFVETILSRF